MRTQAKVAAASADMFGTLLHVSRWHSTFVIALNAESSLRQRLASRSLSVEMHSNWCKVILRSGHGKRPPDIRWNVPSAVVADRGYGIKALATSRR